MCVKHYLRKAAFFNKHLITVFIGEWFESLSVITIPSIKHHPSGGVLCLVDLKGFEPSTPTMRMWCAPNCATSPFTLTSKL